MLHWKQDVWWHHYIKRARCVLGDTACLPFLVSTFYSRMSSDNQPLCMSLVPFSNTVIVPFLMSIKMGKVEKAWQTEEGSMWHPQATAGCPRLNN